EIVEANVAIGARGREDTAIGRDGDACDAVLPTLARTDGSDLLAGRRLPDTDHAIGAGANQPAPVRREGDGIDRASVSADSEDLLPRWDVPDVDRLVGAGGGETLAVGRHGDRGDGPLMALEGKALALGAGRRHHGEEQRSGQDERTARAISLVQGHGCESPRVRE